MFRPRQLLRENIQERKHHLDKRKTLNETEAWGKLYSKLLWKNENSIHLTSIAFFNDYFFFLRDSGFKDFSFWLIFIFVIITALTMQMQHSCFNTAKQSLAETNHWIFECSCMYVMGVVSSCQYTEASQSFAFYMGLWIF